MSKKVIPLSVDALQTLTETYPTPFHLYDERGIRENARLLQKAFSWNQDLKNISQSKRLRIPTYFLFLKRKGLEVTALHIQKWSYVTRWA